MRENRVGRILLGALEKHWVRSLLTAAIIIASMVLEVLPPLVLADAVDALASGHTVALPLAVEYFALLACSGLADALREALIVACGESITHALRSSMMAKMSRLPASYFTEHEAGKTASIQVNDVDAVEEMFSSGLVSMVSDLGTVIAILAVVFTKSIGLGLILLVVLPILSWFTRYVQKRMLTAHTENRTATAEAGGILPETMHIIRALHVYHAEPFAEKRYDRAVQKSFDALEKTNFYDAVYSPVIMTVSAAVIGVMMSLSGQSGAFREFFGISVGTAVALISYVNSIFTPLSSIGMEIQTIQSAAAGWKRVQQFLNEEEMPATPSKQPDAGCVPAVQIDDVSFSYDPSIPVLKHFSLDVNRGEMVTLKGRTGAGKSTLFKLILGLYHPQSGSILIDGIAPEEISAKKRRSLICCVEQKASFVPGTIKDQVTLYDTKYSDAQVIHALEIVGLYDQVKEMEHGLNEPSKESSFSQGQRQLFMIARAVVSDPEILLLDEITSGLDSATEAMVLRALQKASENRTVLSISHRFAKTAGGRIVPIEAIH